MSTRRRIAWISVRQAWQMGIVAKQSMVRALKKSFRKRGPLIARG
jgi:hypothetical protein